MIIERKKHKYENRRVKSLKLLLLRNQWLL